MRTGTGGAGRAFFAAATILVATHALLLILDPAGTFRSNLLLCMYPLLGIVVCLVGAYNESPESRSLWLLFASGLSLALAGAIGMTFYDFRTQLHTQNQARPSDYLFFVYGIPVMLAICSRMIPIWCQIDPKAPPC